METLKAVGVQKGFQTNELRTQAYARILGVKLPDEDTHRGKNPPSVLPACCCLTDSKCPLPDFVKNHRDWKQVEIDFVRTSTSSKSSLPSWLTGNDSQQQLRRLMHSCLFRNPQLHYFQGYGDICATMLAICGEGNAFVIMNELSRTYLK